MKFYDLEWLARKCGTDNKYEITVKVSAEARRESEEAPYEKDKDNPSNELFISKVLSEIEDDTSPISVDYVPPKIMPVPEFDEEPDEPKPEIETYSAAPDDMDLPEEQAEEEETEETESESKSESSNE